MSDYFGKETPKLGFGLMRLPRKGIITDVEQVKKMVDLFMNRSTIFLTCSTSVIIPFRGSLIKPNPSFGVSFPK